MPKRLAATLDSTSAFTVSTYLIETNEYAVAKSTTGKIGVTWNPGAGGSVQGFPHTYGHQQWFILPDPLGEMILAAATCLDGQ